MGHNALGRLDLGQYIRRLDCFDFRRKHKDLPRESSELLELAHAIELEDTIAIDKASGNG